MAMPAPTPIARRVTAIHHEVTVEQAIDHLVDAAQGVVQNQIEIARLDFEQTAMGLLRRAILLLVGVALIGGGLVAGAMAGYAAMPDFYPPEQRLVIIGGVGALIGLGFVLAGAHRGADHGRE
jgi:hypothetical protein